MAIRNTQDVIQVLIEPIPKARTTQVVVQALVAPATPAARLTQIVYQALIQRGGAAGCASPWNMPSPDPYPVPSAGGAQYNFFQELVRDWGEYGREFKDGNPQHNTLQSAAVRRFRFEYRDLSIAEAAQLDAHFASTRGGLSFRLVHPRTGEIINGVRYEEFNLSVPRKHFLRNRNVVLVKYTN